MGWGSVPKQNGAYIQDTVIIILRITLQLFNFSTMITIYHNPRCRKSRAGLAYLESKGVDFTLRNYFKEPFTRAELKEVLKKLGLPAREMIRTQEAEYKQLYKGKELSEEEWIKAILDHPKLFKRPVVVKDDKAVWADPPENMDILF